MNILRILAPAAIFLTPAFTLAEHHEDGIHDAKQAIMEEKQDVKEVKDATEKEIQSTKEQAAEAKSEVIRDVRDVQEDGDVKAVEEAKIEATKRYRRN